MKVVVTLTSVLFVWILVSLFKVLHQRFCVVGCLVSCHIGEQLSLKTSHICGLEKKHVLAFIRYYSISLNKHVLTLNKCLLMFYILSLLRFANEKPLHTEPAKRPG